jgi:transketolase
MSEASATPEMRRVFAETLVELGRGDPRIVVLDNDVDLTSQTALFRLTFPTRFVEVGIAEKNLFGTAAGLAASGFVAVPTTFASFAVRCALDQIVVSIAQPALNVKIPGHYVGGSKAGASHIAVEDVAIMRSLPNMRVADPADNNDLRAVMRAAFNVDGPVYFRVSKLALPEVFGVDHTFEWGKGRILREGREVSIFSTGMLTVMALEAARILERDGIDAEVVHLASIKPIDHELIAASVSKTGCAVAAENSSILAGFGAAVAEVLGDTCPVPLRRIGYRDEWAHSGSIGDLLERHHMTARDVADAARAAMAARSAMASRLAVAARKRMPSLELGRRDISAG